MTNDSGSVDVIYAPLLAKNEKEARAAQVVVVVGGAGRPAVESMARMDSTAHGDMFDAFGGLLFPFSDQDIKKWSCSECSRLLGSLCCTHVQLGLSASRLSNNGQTGCSVCWFLFVLVVAGQMRRGKLT